MELEVVKKLIKKYTAGHGAFLAEADTADRYYRNQTDILLEPPKKRETEQGENPLRNADNRIPSTSTVSWSIRKRPICLQRRLCSIWAIRHLIKH